MKNFIILLLIIISTSVNAQMGVAKIKYDEAEEAYTEKNYNICLEKLNEVIDILKSTNPKVQYLRILCLSNLSEKDPLANFRNLIELNNYCKSYLNDYDNIPDLEEKYRAVYDITEKFKKYPKNEEEYQNVIELRKRGRIYRYNKDSLNYTKAKDFFQKAYNSGDLRSLYELANMYSTGMGEGEIPRSETIANSYYEILSTNGYPEGMYQIGLNYLYGINGYKREVLKAYPLIHDAALKNHLPSVTLNGIIEFCSYQIAKTQSNINASELKRRASATESWLLRAEQNGETSSEFYYYMGKAYLLGIMNGGPNQIKAFSYFQKSADLGNKKGQNALGYSYFVGWGGLGVNTEKASYYFKLAADQFLAAAEYNMSTLYCGAIGHIKDKKIAKYWLDRYVVNPQKSVDDSPSNNTNEMF